MTYCKFKGKRAELGVYDDAWIRGDDCIECIVPSPKIMHDKFTAERHSKILEELNLMHGTYTINFEPTQASLQDVIDNIIKELDKANG